MESIINELRKDYNRFHFIRDKEFSITKKYIQYLPTETKVLLIEFLERSCTAEFSGFLLYKELSRKLALRNPSLSEGFSLLSRDEARHAGFLNKCLADFNINLDLGFLTKARKYTYFAPRLILFATYLSEKIGYWRYITIFRHLQQNFGFRVYPIFKYFEGWCQDENRHGDFFAAILLSQPHLLTGPTSRLLSRFFLVSVFMTMVLNDTERTGFYELLGLDTFAFDMYVIERTNYTASKLFPVSLNLYNPRILNLMQESVELYKETKALTNYSQYDSFSQNNSWFNFKRIWMLMRKTSLQTKIAWIVIYLTFAKPRFRKLNSLKNKFVSIPPRYKI